MQRYQKFEKEIGVGAYGTVYKAMDLQTQQLVALKRIPLEESDDGIPATAVREMSLLKQLRHTNIVSLQNIVLETNLLYLVFELGDLDLKKLMDLALKEKMGQLAGGSANISSTLAANIKYKDVFSMANIRGYMHQIIDGLAYCHSMGVMHRDLKPQNILVSLLPGDGVEGSSCIYVIKIADFGLARAFMPKRELTLEVVTRWYRPPEILLGSNTYSPSVDIWSIGCIFAELLNQGIPLLPGSSEIDQIHKIFYHFGTPDSVSWPDVVNYPHWRPTFPLWPPLAWGSIVPYDFENTPAAAIDLLSNCFMYDPTLRITASNALKHHWFQTLSTAGVTGGLVGTKKPKIVSPSAAAPEQLSGAGASRASTAAARKLAGADAHSGADMQQMESFNEDSNATTISDISADCSSSSSSAARNLPSSTDIDTACDDDCVNDNDATVVLTYGDVRPSPANTRSKRRKVSASSTEQDGRDHDSVVKAADTRTVRRSARSAVTVA